MPEGLFCTASGVKPCDLVRRRGDDPREHARQAGARDQGDPALRADGLHERVGAVDAHEHQHEQEEHHDRAGVDDHLHHAEEHRALRDVRGWPARS